MSWEILLAMTIGLFLFEIIILGVASAVLDRVKDGARYFYII